MQPGILELTDFWDINISEKLHMRNSDLMAVKADGTKDLLI